MDSLLEHTRLKNVAICRRKLPTNLPISEIIRAINGLDIQVLSCETIELLKRMIPLEEEVKAYREYNSARKDPENLTEEDRLMRQFSCVERFATKLQIMLFMSTFNEEIQSLKPQIDAISLASKSVKNSKKFKKILELILAFGNYMNSSKKGPCYGFKLQSLDSITLTKSTKKDMNIVHYIAELVHKQYPELKSFENEVKISGKASQYLLENICSDLKKLEKGFEITKRELENRLNDFNAKDKTKSAQNQTLSNFVNHSGETLTKIRSESNHMEASFKECVGYFGEDSKSIDANSFFGIISRFVNTWKAAEVENEKRRKMEAAKKAAAVPPKAETHKNIHNTLINELKNKHNVVQSKTPHITPDEFKDGTLEDLILGLKSEPYRANNEAMRKSFRSRNRGSAILTSESEAL